MARVSVIVVNWNGRQFLGKCLHSVLAQTYADYDVVVVDNASSDGSPELIRRDFPSVVLIVNERNLGFAAATNTGIRSTSGEYVATINNDAQADPEWLAEVVEAMNSDDSVGMVASKMLFHDRPQVLNSTGISLDCAAIAWDRRGGAVDDPSESSRVEVFGPSAGAALYRRKMLEDVGLFDEDFFMYLEDVDLAWRARLRGWKCIYTPSARVLHVHSGSSLEGSAFKNYHLGRNKIWTIIKNYPSPQCFYFLPLILFYDLASLPYTVLTRGQLSPLQGRLAALRHFRAVLKKRREIQSGRLVDWSEFSKLLHPLESPFALLTRYRHLQKVISNSGPIIRRVS